MTDTHTSEAATMLTVPLYRLAHSRTGDKGNRSNLSVIAWHPALWDVLVQQVVARLQALSGAPVAQLQGVEEAVYFPLPKELAG